MNCLNGMEICIKEKGLVEKRNLIEEKGLMKWEAIQLKPKLEREKFLLKDVEVETLKSNFWHAISQT
jgi:hypothetical protein